MGGVLRFHFHIIINNMEHNDLCLCKTKVKLGVWKSRKRKAETDMESGNGRGKWKNRAHAQKLLGIISSSSLSDM